MVESLSEFCDVRPQSSVIFRCWARMEFRAAIGIKSLRRRQSAGKLNALKHNVHITRVRKVVGADSRRVQRIRRAQTNIATAERMQQGWPHGECVAFYLLESMLNKIANAKMKLQIGYLSAGRSFHESAGLRHVGGQRPAF